MIVGIGNRFRRDDGAGLVAVERLRGMLPDHVRLLAAPGDITSLLDEWERADTVIVIDATSSGSTPGTIRRYDAHDHALPAMFSRSSTHAFGVAEAVELARALGRLPSRVVVFGIEGREFGAGEGLSPDVDRGVDEVVRRAREEAAGRA